MTSCSCLLAELSETQDPTEHAELAVRMAMLLWDGQSKPDAALAILGAVHHPVASALRLQAALDGRTAKSQALSELYRLGHPPRQQR
jgi:hypothetical protein